MGKERQDQAPAPDPRPWRNPNTGEIHQVPKGIDPGFDYNPGAAWKRGRVALPEDAVTPLPAAPPARALPPAPPLATRPARPPQPDPGPVSVRPATPEQLVPIPPAPASPDAVAAFAEAPRGKLALGEMPTAARTVLGSRTGVVQLSAETIEKQGWRHAELTAADYRAIPALTSDPHVVLRWPGDRVALLRGIEGAPKTGRGSVAHIAIVKATENGRENYLVSVHRLRRKTLAQALRRGVRIAGDFEKLG